MSARKSPLRILITPNYGAAYDQRMVAGLATGFHTIGHQALALPAPIPAVEVARMCEEYSFDVVIQVNRTRDRDVPLPSNVRHIAWFQDVFPETKTGFIESFHDSDILYALGDADVLGLDMRPSCYVGSLVCGVDQEIFDYPQEEAPCLAADFSLCGFIPSPPSFITRNEQPSLLNLVRSHPLRSLLRIPKFMYQRARWHFWPYYVPYTALMAMMDTALSSYRPLRGELDIHQLAIAMRKNAAPHAGVALSDEGRQPVELSKWTASYAQCLLRLGRIKKRIGGKDPRSAHHLLSPFEKSISYFAREYPRLLDRVTLIREILQVSEAVELYGPGWDMHEEFRPYAKGVITTRDGLLDVYQRSRINLANNTHGLGLHSRTLECMAVGGFIFTHESPHDTKPGGMLTSFEPGIHYGAYTPENLREEASRWIKEGTRRKQVGRRAAEVVRQQHCWHHRALQIFGDLGK